MSVKIIKFLKKNLKKCKNGPIILNLAKDGLKLNKIKIPFNKMYFYVLILIFNFKNIKNLFFSTFNLRSKLSKIKCKNGFDPFFAHFLCSFVFFSNKK